MDSLNVLNSNIEKDTLPKKISVPAKTLIAFTGGIGVTISLIAVAFVAPAFRKFCLPYVPATTEQIKNILLLLPCKQTTTKKLLDIGSGDGRIVFATSNHGFLSHGVELNRWLVYYSRMLAIKRQTKNVKFFKKDLWKFDITMYDYITVFGVEQMMPSLEKKFINEAKNYCKIIACRYPLPNLVPKKIIGRGINTVWLYEIENNQS